MGFLCSCGDEFPTPDILIFHLQLRHPAASVINHYKCFQSIGCSGRIFDSLDRFRRHLSTTHAADIGAVQPVDNLENEDNGIDNVDQNNDIDNMEHVVEGADAELNVPDFETFAKAVHSSGLIFAAKLYDKDTLPRSVVQDVITYVDVYLGGFVKMLKTKVMHSLNNMNNDENNAEVRDIEAMFTVLENPFAEIATEAQRINAFKNAGAYIGPTSYFIGSSLKEVRVNGIMIPQMVPSYGQLISMEESLKNFLELPNVFDKIMLNYANLSEENNVISNFIQGSLWKHISEPYVDEGKVVLPLFFYSDDYENNNGLGSHALDQKTNGLYYKIPCIPPEYLSMLRYIFIAAVFYVNDRKEYGNDACLGPVFQQLKSLEDNGILIDLPDRTVRVYFLLGLVLGDNLGLNTILGLVESFRANYYCRVCKGFNQDLKFMVREDAALLRTPLNHNADLALNDYTLTGLKENCKFNQLDSFHSTVNVCGDVLHDIEEGLCGYALPRLLHWLIHVRKYFSHETFIDRVNTYSYGPSECGNRPPTSKLSIDRIISCSKFLLSGSESLCLTQNLGQMVGDLVPVNDDVWCYYLSLLDLLDFVLAPSFVIGSEVLFKTLVTEHHEMYISTFDEALKPIHHMVVHYFRYMLLVGPPIHTSTKRFESKNRESVQAARSTNSRVNLLLTLMIKNQLKFCYQLMCKNAFSDRLVTGVGKLIKVGDLPYGEILELAADETVTSFKWIDFLGTEYRIDNVVVFQSDILYPKFGKICDILIYGNNQIVFVLKILVNRYYYNHYHSFTVRETDDLHVCHPSTLVSPQTLWLRYNTKGDKLVGLRCSVT